MLWILVQALFVDCWLPGSRHRVWLLRRFGAQVGSGVVIKQHVRVKFPWKLTIGDYVWIGERVWIDNLASVEVGSHVCLSQNAYLCTGSHDWSSSKFDLITQPISIAEHAWICAQATVAPGVVVENGAVLGLGSVATQRLKAWQIYQGVPAIAIRNRKINNCQQA